MFLILGGTLDCLVLDDYSGDLGPLGSLRHVETHCFLHALTLGQWCHLSRLLGHLAHHHVCLNFCRKAFLVASTSLLWQVKEKWDLKLAWLFKHCPLGNVPQGQFWRSETFSSPWLSQLSPRLEAYSIYYAVNNVTLGIILHQLILEIYLAFPPRHVEICSLLYFLCVR